MSGSQNRGLKPQLDMEGNTYVYPPRKNACDALYTRHGLENCAGDHYATACPFPLAHQDSIAMKIKAGLCLGGTRRLA